ncbi:MAG TPA: large conductance mechanosensitive channel protein MscL, partial [Polyangia bacterium]|nr:large conductance mechanosensitive channel protein MscL [Polyangia bacterium]
MKLLKEFKEFAAKGSIVDLAVAVVIGGAFGKIVSAFVSDLVMPLVNALTPGGDWRKIELTSLHFKLGDFAGTVVDFVIVAVVIFIVIVKMMGAMKKAPVAEEPKPETKQCPECLETVPKAARRCRACTAVFTAMLMLLLGHSAFAQSEPGTQSSEVANAEAANAEAARMEAAKAEAANAEAARMEAAKAEAAKAEAARIEAEKAAAAANAVEWKAQGKGGFMLTSGNSQATNATFGVNASRKQGNNKLALEGGLAYGKSNNLVPQKGPDPANPTGSVVTGYDRPTVVSANNWAAKVRYDRFLTENNSLYVSGQAAGDKVAGKKFFGGGQAGYSRQLLKDSMNLVVAELGYDFSYLVFE